MAEPGSCACSAQAPWEKLRQGVPGETSLNTVPRAILVAGSILAAVTASAQEGKRPPDKPPISQGWIDIATYASPGMGGMGGLMGGMMGGGDGSYVDVTLRTSRNPNLAEALQSVPEASRLAPTLQLEVLPQAEPVRDPVGQEPVAGPTERPKGKIKLYWSCGAAIRPGQPEVVDFSTGTVGELADIFKGRRATQRGAHSAPGRPVWPNLVDKRRAPEGASLVGAHAFTGQGGPERCKFNLPAAQDIMPSIALKQAEAGGVTQLSWQALPTARVFNHCDGRQGQRRRQRGVDAVDLERAARFRQRPGRLPDQQVGGPVAQGKGIAGAHDHALRHTEGNFRGRRGRHAAHDRLRQRVQSGTPAPSHRP